MVGEDCGWIYHVGVVTMTIVGFLAFIFLIYWAWMQKKLYDITKACDAVFDWPMFVGSYNEMYNEKIQLLKELDSKDIHNLRVLLNNFDRIQWKKDKGD
jgi:hypothetical protein